MSRLALIVLLAGCAAHRAPLERPAPGSGGAVGLSSRVVELCEGQVCYLRCSGSQRLTNGTLTLSGTNAGLVINGTTETLIALTGGLGGVRGIAFSQAGLGNLTAPALYWNTGATTLFVNGGANAFTSTSGFAASAGGYTARSATATLSVGTAGSAYLAADAAAGTVDVYNGAQLRIGQTNGGGIRFNNSPWADDNNVTPSGFCTTPAVTSGVGSSSFLLDVGGACAASTGTITFAVAATNGYACSCTNVTSGATRTVTQTTNSTTTCVLQSRDWAGAAANWVNGDDLVCHAFAY